MKKRFSDKKIPRDVGGDADFTGMEGAEPDNPQEKEGTPTAWDERLRVSNALYTPASESFRRLRSHLLDSDHSCRKLLVTSIMPGEGKGFVCANLGISFARDLEHHVLLLDCDLRRPTLARLFGVTNDSGMAEYLGDSQAPFPKIRRTGQAKLFLIPSGAPPDNPSELLSSARMLSFVSKLADHDDSRIILVDSPPSSFASETFVLARHLDGVILVIRPGAAPKEQVRKFVDMVGSEKIRGVVYNANPQDKVRGLLNMFKGYGYGYGYRYNYY